MSAALEVVTEAAKRAPIELAVDVAPDGLVYVTADPDAELVEVLTALNDVETALREAGEFAMLRGSLGIYRIGAAA